jgi:hypothetical protein
MTINEETWIPVLGGLYEVSNLGSVRNFRTKQFRRFGIDRDGYLALPYRKNGRKGKWSEISVHCLVAVAFLGPRPGGLEINHKNGIKTDNRSENLEYITHDENIAHATRMGKFRGNGGRRSR